MCILSYKPRNLAIVKELLFDMRDTKRPNTPRELPRHTSVLLNNISRIQYWMHPSLSCFRQTYIYPVQIDISRILFTEPRLPNGCLSSINPFLRTPTRREGQKSRCSTDWWIFIRCLSRFFSWAKVSLQRVAFVLLSDCMAEWEDGHWFLSACLSISAPLLYPSVEEHREGALLEITPQLCLSG